MSSRSRTTDKQPYCPLRWLAPAGLLLFGLGSLIAQITCVGSNRSGMPPPESLTIAPKGHRPSLAALRQLPQDLQRRLPEGLHGRDEHLLVRRVRSTAGRETEEWVRLALYPRQDDGKQGRQTCAHASMIASAPAAYPTSSTLILT